MIKIGIGSSGSHGLFILLPTFQNLPLLYSTSTTNQPYPNPNPNPSSSFPKFLVNSLGFSTSHSFSISAELAKHCNSSAPKKVSHFYFVENANSVIQFFQQLGFQHSDIRNIVSRDHRILVSRVKETLKPQIELLNELGISRSDLIRTIVKNPVLLRQRLEPAIQALRTVLCSDHNVATFIMRLKNCVNLETAANNLMMNVETLLIYCGISSDTILRHVFRVPRLFVMRTEKFRGLLVRVEQLLGIPPDSPMFFYGIYLLSYHREKHVEDKFEVFRSFGWTQSDIMRLIGQNPLCLTSSEVRIKESLEFLMNQLGYKPAYLASQPLLFTSSREKRLLPRHRVLQVLKQKGLLRMNYPLLNAVVLAESIFLKRFVLPFEEVHEVYAQYKRSAPGSLTVKGPKG